MPVEDVRRRTAGYARACSSWSPLHPRKPPLTSDTDQASREAGWHPRLVPPSSYQPHPDDQRVLAVVDPDEIVATLGRPGSRSRRSMGLRRSSRCSAGARDRMRDLGRTSTLGHRRCRSRARPGFPRHGGRARPRRWGASGCLGGSDATTRARALGHTDVVPPGDLAAWQGQDPFRLRVDNGIAYARGACDMKGGVAAIRRTVGRTPRRSLTHPAGGHACGVRRGGRRGRCVRDAKARARADTCIIAEPTGTEIISSNAGSLTFRLVVRGVSTHGSTRTRGVSAIDAVRAVHGALRELENAPQCDLGAGFRASRPPLATRRSGRWRRATGRAPSPTVSSPRAATAYASTRRSPTRSLRSRPPSSTRAATHRWLREHPVEVTWPGGRFAPGRLPTGHALSTRSAARRRRDRLVGPLLSADRTVQTCVTTPAPVSRPCSTAPARCGMRMRPTSRSPSETSSRRRRSTR